jgi:hypothetical protein
MGEIVYALCALTSVACAALLVRAYFRTHMRLLLWCALCFVGLAVNNVGLFVDLVLVPSLDLFYWRTVPAVIGLLLLACAFAWEEL